MTDYDDVRFCCKGSDICNNCWPLMQFAVKILDAGLQGKIWKY
jgi:DNA primase small subunit